jgi:hypothetical protein
MKFFTHEMKKMAVILTIAVIGIVFTRETGAQEKFILTVTEFTIKNGH